VLPRIDFDLEQATANRMFRKLLSLHDQPNCFGHSQTSLDATLSPLKRSVEQEVFETLELSLPEIAKFRTPALTVLLFPAVSAVSGFSQPVPEMAAGRRKPE